MLRTRFSPITARPTRPISDAFVIWRNKIWFDRTGVPAGENSRNNLEYAKQIGCASGQERQGARSQNLGARRRAIAFSSSSSSSSSSSIGVNAVHAVKVRHAAIRVLANAPARTGNAQALRGRGRHAAAGLLAPLLCKP